MSGENREHRQFLDGMYIWLTRRGIRCQLELINRVEPGDKMRDCFPESARIIHHSHGTSRRPKLHCNGQYARTGKYDEEIGESRYFESGRESGVDAVQAASVDVAWTWTWTWGDPRESGGGEEKVRSKDGDISAAELNGQ